MTKLLIGYEVIRSYKRLSYTAWHAIAEFVDNSTQSYFDNRVALDEALKQEGERFKVDVSYDGDAFVLTVKDNAMGMSGEDLDSAMTVGLPPPDPTGRSRYGMGLKTAACWLGDQWSLTTSKLGTPTEFTVTVDVEKIAGGDAELPIEASPAPADAHYTVLTIRELNRKLRARTIGKVGDYLASMYRNDIRSGVVELSWQGAPLRWEDAGDEFLRAPSGSPYKKDLDFSVDGKRVTGWAGVLEHGSRSRAGLSLLHSGRVIKGWPESYRPQEMYGQIEGSNDLVNQRLVGELNLDAYEVTHTKDSISWSEGEEERLGQILREQIDDLVVVANTARVRKQVGPGPSALRKAARNLQDGLEGAPPVMPGPSDIPEEFVSADRDEILRQYEATRPDLQGALFGWQFRAYLSDEESSDTPFVLIPGGRPESVIVLVANMRHPFLASVSTTEALGHYLKLLMIDVVAYAVEDRWSEVQRWVGTRDRMMRAWRSGS